MEPYEAIVQYSYGGKNNPLIKAEVHLTNLKEYIEDASVKALRKKHKNIKGLVIVLEDVEIIEKKDKFTVLNPLDIMKLLNAIYPLSNDEKAEYIQRWKALSFRRKMSFRIESLCFWFEYTFFGGKLDDIEIPDTDEPFSFVDKDSNGG